MSEDHFGQLVGGLFIMAGPTVFLIVFLVRAWMWRTAPGGGEHTEGRIVSKREKSVGDSGTEYLATVEYLDHNFFTVTKEFNIGRRGQKELTVGTQLPVIFDPRRPKRARLGPADRLPAVLQDWKRTRRLGRAAIAVLLGIFFIVGAVTAIGALM